MRTLQAVQHLVVECQHTEYNLGAPQLPETRIYLESLGFTCTAPFLCNNGPDGDHGFERVPVSSM